jgi:hypothetical protein
LVGWPVAVDVDVDDADCFAFFVLIVLGYSVFDGFGAEWDAGPEFASVDLCDHRLSLPLLTNDRLFNGQQ